MDNSFHISNRFRGYLPVVIDVETGGFNPLTDALLEVADAFAEPLADVGQAARPKQEQRDAEDDQDLCEAGSHIAPSSEKYHPPRAAAMRLVMSLVRFGAAGRRPSAASWRAVSCS